MLLFYDDILDMFRLKKKKEIKKVNLPIERLNIYFGML